MNRWIAKRAWTVAFIAGLVTAGVCVGDWAMLGHDAGRSGATGSEVRPPFARKWWRAFPEEGLMAGVQPVIAEGKVFAGTLKGVLHAMDGETGKDVWTYQAGGAILHSCAAGGGRVFFGAADGRIYAVNAADGKPAWTVQTGSAVWNAPVVFEGMVIVGSRDGKLYAVDAANGQTRWVAATGGPIVCSPAVGVKTRRVYVGSEDMRVYAFDLADGKQVWKSDKLPGVSFRGYHPVIAPDGSVMITVTPCAGGDAIQQIMLDMVKEVFGDFASWRHKKEENDRLRKENFELMQKPETYQKQLDYLRKRLTDEKAYQTFFVLDAATGKQKFVTPVVYAESMNGPGAPPLVTADGRVIVKYSALLRSRYEHYSPFLNVGYLDTATGYITPIMDQSRTYGWHDSLLLVHDEQCQLAAGGKVLFNTHQNDVNGMDLVTLKGYEQPMCHNVHEVQVGVINSIWASYLVGKELPMGWEWFGRGTAVYGGGSVIDVPIAIDGDSFYYVPTHEINAGVVILGYKMQANGNASQRAPEPSEKLTDEGWKSIQGMQWDWDMLEMPRLNTALAKGLPEKRPGTRQRPLVEEGQRAAAAVTDEQLDRVIWDEPRFEAAGGKVAERWRGELGRAVAELIGTEWRPLVFPAAKAPGEAYRLFIEPTETLYTLAMAYPHLTGEMQGKVKGQVARMCAAGGALDGPVGKRTYDAQAGEVRSAYDPAPERLMRVMDDLARSETARVYPLWLWAKVTGDWGRMERDWPAIKGLVGSEGAKGEADCGNGRISGLIAACRIARRMKDKEAEEGFVKTARAAMRGRLAYELAYTEGGLIMMAPKGRTIFGRWRNLTPEVGRLLREHAGAVHRRLMDVYVDHHRPTWWLAWNVELLWRNESPFSFPTMAMEVFAARAMILGEGAEKLAGFVDLPWCKGDEWYVQKVSLVMGRGGE